MMSVRRSSPKLSRISIISLEIMLISLSKSPRIDSK
ncbi:hypothetical protein MGSAQ_000183 [marine sediment metagenome]|uniref:Uncharacterized protein n=1 Tax=marine sediment metagenome TaxID=412755 RepID=A0A1B6NY42_9ZZZZ